MFNNQHLSNKKATQDNNIKGECLMHELQFNSDTHVMINDDLFNVLVLPKKETILQLTSLKQIKQHATTVAIKEKFDFEGYEQARKNLAEAKAWIKTLNEQLSMDVKTFSDLLANNQETDEESSVRLAKTIRSNMAYYKQSQEDVLSDISSYAAMRKEQAIDRTLEQRVHNLLNPRLGKRLSLVVNTVISSAEAEIHVKQEDAFKNKVLEMIARFQPQWIYETKKGQKKVDEQKLAQEILDEIPQQRYEDLIGGAYWNEALKLWLLSGRSAYVDKKITEKLADFNLWDPKAYSSVKKFIFNMSYTTDSNPFIAADTRFIQFLNGVYDIEEDQLVPHLPEYYLTQKREFELDVSGKEPTKTLNWLKALVKEDATVIFICEMIGYFYYRTYEPFQKIFLLHGSGNNGKSVFIEHIKKMLHESNVSNVMMQDLDSNVNRFARSQLFQKEVNLFADIDTTHLSTTGVLKMLTGGDTIMAENKNENGFSFVNYAKLLFSANTLPTFTDSTIGFHRRVEVIPFEAVIDDLFKSEHDIKEVEKEIPQFSYYCLRTFKAARDRGHFTSSVAMEEKKRRWVDTMDTFDRFLIDCCEVLDEAALTHELAKYTKDAEKDALIAFINKPDVEKKLNRLLKEYGQPTKELYDYFKKYCEEENAKSIGKQKFKERLQSKGIQVQRKKIGDRNVERYGGVFFSTKKAAQLGYEFYV